MTGSWLSGPPTSPDRVQDWRGQRLGLPPDGAGSVAPFGRRFAAFVVDSVAADLLALLWGYRPGATAYGVVVMGAFLAIELVFVAAFGQTPGMRLLGLRVAAVGGGKPALRWVAVRTFLLALAVPPVVIDRDNRGLHDRASGAVVVRAAAGVSASSRVAPGSGSAPSGSARSTRPARASAPRRRRAGSP